MAGSRSTVRHAKGWPSSCADGSAAANESIELSSSHGGRTVTTDRGGLVEVTELIEGEYAVTIKARDGRIDRSGIQVRRGQRTQLDLRLAPRFVASGKVVLPDGIPHLFASTLRREGEIRGPMQRLKSDGVFRLDGLDPGRYEVTLLGPGYASRQGDPAWIVIDDHSLTELTVKEGELLDREEWRRRILDERKEADREKR